MPTSDFIQYLLGCEDMIIDSSFFTPRSIHICFHLKRKMHTCPKCGTQTDKIHDYRTSILKDIPLGGRKTYLHYRKRRYVCPCCGKRFYEDFPLTAKYYRITSRLSLYAISLLHDTHSVSSVAESLNISRSTIFRRLRSIQFPGLQNLPSVLSIDEFRGNAGGQKFQAILTDPRKRSVLDILPGRSQVALMQYFQKFKDRKNVQYIVMDMNQVYRDIALNYFPNATIVIDRFHVVRYVT